MGGRPPGVISSSVSRCCRDVRFDLCSLIRLGVLEGSKEVLLIEGVTAPWDPMQRGSEVCGHNFSGKVDSVQGVQAMPTTSRQAARETGTGTGRLRVWAPASGGGPHEAHLFVKLPCDKRAPGIGRQIFTHYFLGHINVFSFVKGLINELVV